MCTSGSPCDTFSLPSSSDEADFQIMDWCSLLGNNERDDYMKFDSLDPSFKKLIQLCLDVEQSKGMLRVINRSLLPLYKQVNKSYRDSAEFKEILNRTGRMIMKYPKFKFTYIKSLCEKIKQNKKKKRISFVTINTALKSNQMKHGHNKMNTKTNVCLNDRQDVLSDETIIIDDDEKEDLNCTFNSASKYNPPFKSSGGTVSGCAEIVIIEKENSVDVPKQINSNFSPNLELFTEQTSSEQQLVGQENLLIPQKVEQHIDDDLKGKIKSVEDEIAKLKEKIDILEEAEVDTDTGRSQYILCDIYKTQVVGLYNHLCSLTESPSVKRHEVHLSVKEGHSEAPVKILEAFLNNNIQDNGYPSFPDFSEVMRCVVLANDIHKLGWNATQIKKEARMLFTQCGRALQKLRQIRDWNHLLDYTYMKDDFDDPAEHDTELLSKLEANKARARNMEMDIINKYAAINIENKKKQGKLSNTTLLTNNNYSNTSDSDTDSVILCEEAKNDKFFKKLSEFVKIEKSDTDCESSVIEHDENRNIYVKQENSLPNRLEELGTNFSVTIEVDDPLLVLEISSDSDDDFEV